MTDSKMRYQPANRHTFVEGRDETGKWVRIPVDNVTHDFMVMGWTFKGLLHIRKALQRANYPVEEFNDKYIHIGHKSL